MARILLIEDDPNARGMLRFRLEKEQHEIWEAADGEEGWDKALRRPDLIIMDVRIPKIDGWQLCKLLRDDDRTTRIPILMLTGCSQSVQADYGRRCGADAYLTKPWDPNQFMEITRNLLKHPHSNDAAA